MFKAILERLLYFILGALVLHIIITKHCDINTYCWKYTETQQKQDLFFGFDENGENMEIIVTLPDSCGGTVEKAIETPYKRSDFCDGGSLDF